MPILIDGHNLIGRMPGLSLQDPDDEEKLVALLAAYRARTGKAITVVFDPGMTFALPETRRRGGLEVVFAAHGTRADDVILHRISQSRNPSGTTVVTSDRELAAKVAQRGARVRSAEDFARALGASKEDTDRRGDVSLSAEELEDWLALFQGRARPGARRSGKKRQENGSR